MNRFVTATIKIKNEGGQAFQPITIKLSTDAILLYKEAQVNFISLTLKPEYEAKIKTSLGIHHQASIEYITISKQEETKLSE